MNTHDLIKIIIAIMSALSGCAKSIETKTDEQKYCDSWSPRPPFCKPIELPEGWSPTEVAPLMEWLQLLLASGSIKIGFQSEPNKFLLKDTYDRVYPLAWKKIE